MSEPTSRAALLDKLAHGLRCFTPVKVQYARKDAADLLAWLESEGYAVVKLPEQRTDKHGDPTWHVDTDNLRDDGHVYLFDGHAGARLGINAVGVPVWDPKLAESLAAALLAGARYWAMTQMGDNDE